MRALYLLLLASCSSSPQITADAAPDVQAADVQADAGSRSAECQDQDQKLQAALDGARKSPNALLAVKNVACGNTVYVSGDEQTAKVDSLWRIGSITKTFVSASILTLVKEGKLALADPLSKFVPNLMNTNGVTIEMLLDHRSGIFNYTEDAAFFANRDKPVTPQQIVDVATSHPPYFAPDADFHYSNTNYVLLGMILETVTAMKAGAVLHARAIDPAKLSNTLFDGEDMVEPTRMARGFNGGIDVTFFAHPSGPWTAGAMVATGADIATWVETLYGSSTVLGEPERMLLISKTSALATSKYGLGVILLDTKAGPAYGHSGAIDGFRSVAFFWPMKKTAIVVFTNRATVAPDDIFNAAVTALFP